MRGISCRYAAGICRPRTTWPRRTSVTVSPWVLTPTIRGVAAADPDVKIVCFKEPYPERKKVIADFVAWSKANPSFMKDAAVDTLFRFLAGAYPCK